MPQTIILTGERQRAYAKQCIDAAPVGYAIRIAERTRTDDQNAKLHAMLADIRNQVPAMAAFSIEQMKLRFMDAFGSEVVYLPKLEGSGMFPVGQRTSKLSVKQFAGLVELVYKYGAEHSIVWSETMPE